MKTFRLIDLVFQVLLIVQTIVCFIILTIKDDEQFFAFALIGLHQQISFLIFSWRNTNKRKNVIYFLLLLIVYFGPIVASSFFTDWEAYLIVIYYFFCFFVMIYYFVICQLEYRLIPKKNTYFEK